MQIFISLLVLLVSISGAAFEGEENLSGLTGRFATISTNQTVESTKKYIDCSKEKSVEMTLAESSLVIRGLGKFDLVFRDINGGPVGMPGPLIGFSQRETRFIELSENQFLLESRHRQCEPLVGKVGCFGKRWRVTQSLIFYQEPLVEKNQAEFTYTPFEGSDPEICLMVKQSNN